MASALILTIVLVGGAIVLLVSANLFLGAVTLVLHENPFINSIAKYQIFALLLAFVVSGITLRVRPDSRGLVRVGTLSAMAEKELWLGISGETSWRRNAAQILVFISLTTGVFMTLAVWKTGAIHHFRWSFVPWILLFSCTNALAEELIFRFAIHGNLTTVLSKSPILLASAVLFGLPHYNGFPNGVLGVIMAGVLGYVLSKATYETNGLGIALAIHIVQDIIIFTAMVMMKAA